jgi:exopolysaccharide biosynthesis WecB/TagA/CpsF family protein
MRADIPSITVLRVPVATLTTADVRAELLALHAAGRPALVAYANAHALNLATQDAEYHAVLCAAELVLNDGSGLDLAARVEGRRFPENLNGTDLNPKILELAAEQQWSVYFLGAAAGVAKEAAARLTAQIPGLQVVGTRDGYFPPDALGAVVSEIRSIHPDVLMVAMGNPMQEKWLADHLEATGALIGIGVGAFFDFAAVRVPRAPAWMNRLGVEWLFRLCQEPGRLWRRYLVGNPVFVAHVLRERWPRLRS